MAGAYKTEGIVLRCLKYSESSIIADVYTLDKGLRSYIISGLGSKKSRAKVSYYRHLNIITVVAYDKEGNKLARTKEQGLQYHYETLTHDVVKSSVALFALEVVKNAIREAEPNTELYYFIKDFLVRLDKTQSHVGSWPIWFLLDLMPHIGIQPLGNHTHTNQFFDLLNGQYVKDHNENTLNASDSTLISNASRNRHTALSKAKRSTVIDNLILYYKMHVESWSDLKSVSVLREILA